MKQSCNKKEKNRKIKIKKRQKVRKTQRAKKRGN